MSNAQNQIDCRGSRPGKPPLVYGQPEEWQVLEDEQELGWVDMPHVDDLEIAAAAAEAALAAEKEQKRLLLRRKRLLSGSSARKQASDESRSDESGVEEVVSEPCTSEEAVNDNESSPMESSEESNSEEEDLLSAKNVASSLECKLPLLVHLEVDGRENVHVELQPREDPADEMDSGAESEAWAVNDLQEMLHQMQEDGADSRAARRAAEAESMQEPVLPLDVDIRDNDELLPAGHVTAVLGNQVIIQATASSRPLADGSILCLPDRQLLGKVEDLFGPVECPMYMALCCGAALQSVSAGIEVLFVERLSTFVAVTTEAPMAGAADVEEEEEEEEEERFSELGVSEDNAEAALQSHAASNQNPVTMPRGRHTIRGRGRRGPLPGPHPWAGRSGHSRGRGRSKFHLPSQNQQQSSALSADLGPSPFQGLSERRAVRGRSGPRSMQRSRAGPERGRSYRNSMAPAPLQMPLRPHIGSTTLPPRRPPPGESPQGQWVWIPPEHLQPQPPPVRPFLAGGRGPPPSAWERAACLPQSWPTTATHLSAPYQHNECFEGLPARPNVQGRASPELAWGLQHTDSHQDNPAVPLTFYPSGLP